jgi:hypothetical protein
LNRFPTRTECLQELLAGKKVRSKNLPLLFILPTTVPRLMRHIYLLITLPGLVRMETGNKKIWGEL